MEHFSLSGIEKKVSIEHELLAIDKWSKQDVIESLLANDLFKSERGRAFYKKYNAINASEKSFVRFSILMMSRISQNDPTPFLSYNLDKKEIAEICELLEYHQIDTIGLLASKILFSVAAEFLSRGWRLLDKRSDENSEIVLLKKQ